MYLPMFDVVSSTNSVWQIFLVIVSFMFIVCFFLRPGEVFLSQVYCYYMQIIVTVLVM
jgi:hypothetical protein